MTLYPKIDELTGSYTGVDYPHDKIHAGSAFFSEATDESLADNATITVAFRTPTGTKRAHMLVEATTLVGGDLKVYENATWTTNTGTVNPILNRKRLATMTSSMLLEDKSATPAFGATDNVLIGPTGLFTGTAIRLFDLFIWGIKNKEKGTGRDSAEWILKPDTPYVITFTAEGANNKGQILLNWYEHTDDVHA